MAKDFEKIIDSHNAAVMDFIVSESLKTKNPKPSEINNKIGKGVGVIISLETMYDDPDYYGLAKITVRVNLYHGGTISDLDLIAFFKIFDIPGYDCEKLEENNG